jgi:hypothetical protein
MPDQDYEKPKRDPQDSGRARPPLDAASPLTRTLGDVFVLGIGLLIGFFWHLYNSSNGTVHETRNVIIGLVIIISFMVRYLFLGRQVEERGYAAIGMQFVREIFVFSLGLVLGLFWYEFYRERAAADVHIIIVLLVLIFALARFLYLRRQATGGDTT